MRSFPRRSDSAGSSAKQARDRETQAILPLRGKILNVASASLDKMRANQEMLRHHPRARRRSGSRYKEDALPLHERVVIMTDADVDGAHIASLLMTFFFREMQGSSTADTSISRCAALSHDPSTTVYARDDAHREELMQSGFTGRGKIEVSRFKGLGEMPARYLWATTMNPAQRTLLRVKLPSRTEDPDADTTRTEKLVETLMGRRPGTSITSKRTRASPTTSTYRLNALRFMYSGPCGTASFALPTSVDPLWVRRHSAGNRSERRRVFPAPSTSSKPPPSCAATC